MKITNYTINTNGLAQIAEFLRANHKKGEMIAEDQSMLYAWAADAEFQLDQGNPAMIEIKVWDSIHGRTQTFNISNDGVDSEEINA
ncbi:MAG TPA: hypothetical protein VFA14_00180 [Herbaspirillum sp.]|nr:hypothetical protein [Herbaspirillum sp.]